MTLKTVILAAGQGTRMKSNIPKVLHEIAGKPMVEKVVESVDNFKGDVVIVYGHNGQQVKSKIHNENIIWIEQADQLGTGHAVQQAFNEINDKDIVVILYADVPLITEPTIRKLIEKVSANTMALLTVELDDPTGYGRIIRNESGVSKIVEQKDASAEELETNEINTGIMSVMGKSLKKWLSQLNNSNAQREYYLTDIIEMAVSDNVTVTTVQPSSEYEVMGVNSRSQLNELERHYQLRLAEKLMDAGVTLADKNRLDIRGELNLNGIDCFIDVNCVFEGDIELGSNVHIGPNCIISNSKIADNVTIKANSVLEDCMIASDCTIGPFARLRPGAELSEDVHIGNFVEVKKSKVGVGSKINHLSYIGDSDIGSGVNIGAGTITCNYDGVNKFRTTIEDGAFIGSGSQLVAPIKVGAGATLGAGTTLSKNAPNDALTVTRAKQMTLKSWKKPIKD